MRRLTLRIYEQIYDIYHPLDEEICPRIVQIFAIIFQTNSPCVIKAISMNTLSILALRLRLLSPYFRLGRHFLPLSRSKKSAINRALWLANGVFLLFQIWSKKQLNIPTHGTREMYGRYTFQLPYKFLIYTIIT